MHNPVGRLRKFLMMMLLLPVVLCSACSGNGIRAWWTGGDEGTLPVVAKVMNGLMTLGTSESDIDLWWAATTGNLDLARQAVEDGADVNHLSGALGETTDFGAKEKNAFRIACFVGKRGVARYLIESGADPNYVDANGEPILAYVARENDIELCQLLLDYGADVNAKGKDGYTALEYEFLGVTSSNAENDFEIQKTMTLLLEHGARVTHSTLTAAMKGYNNDGYCKYNLVHDVLERLIASGQKSELSPVREAAILGDSVKVDRLVTSGQMAKKDADIVLFYTAALGDPKTLQLLLDKGAKIDATDGTGNSLLAIAARSGNAEMLQYLIDEGLSLNAANWDGSTPLEQAAACGQPVTAKLLLDSGAETSSSVYAVSALQYAARHGDVSMVRLLLAHGCSVSEIDVAMSDAAQYGQATVLAILFGHLGDPQATTADETALETACTFGRLDCVKYLIEHGTNSEGALAIDPLGAACTAGHLEVARYLIDHGASVSGTTTETAGPDGDTPLMHAVTSSYEIVELLVMNGANVDQRAGGETALLSATKWGSDRIVEYLLKHGASVNVQDSDGWTPLMFAAYDGYANKVSLLLKHGADPNIKNGDGLTAKTILKMKNAGEISKLLRAAG